MNLETELMLFIAIPIRLKNRWSFKANPLQQKHWFPFLIRVCLWNQIHIHETLLAGSLWSWTTLSAAADSESLEKHWIHILPDSKAVRLWPGWISRSSRLIYSWPHIWIQALNLCSSANVLISVLHQPFCFYCWSIGTLNVNFSWSVWSYSALSFHSSMAFKSFIMELISILFTWPHLKIRHAFVKLVIEIIAYLL